MMRWEDAAILHYCKRCESWRHIDEFRGGGIICEACVRSKRHAAGRDIARGYAITPMGKAYLAQLRAREQRLARSA